MTPNEFKAKWSKVSGNERQTYQEHFRDLCAMLDQPTPSAADPTEVTDEQILERILLLNHQRVHR